MTYLAYCAINETTKQFFQGRKGQVAFNKISSLRLSMTMANVNYNTPEWTFYEMNSEDKTMTKITY